MGNKYNPILKSFIADTGDLKKGCAKFIKSLSESERCRLEGLYSEVSFTVRRYGRSDFFCWPHHSVFRESGIDPWPSNRYPKNVLMADLAIRT
jgi:hypothetical protein